MNPTPRRIHSSSSIVELSRNSNSGSKLLVTDPTNGGNTTSPHDKLQIFRKKTWDLKNNRKSFLNTAFHVHRFLLTRFHDRSSYSVLVGLRKIPARDCQPGLSNSTGPMHAGELADEFLDFSWAGSPKPRFGLGFRGRKGRKERAALRCADLMGVGA